MPGPYIPNLIRMVVTYVDSSHGEAQNTLHFDNNTAGDFASACALIQTNWEAWWGTGALAATQLRQYISNQVDPVRMRFTDLSVAAGAYLEQQLTLNPGNEAQRLPPDLSIVVSWLTGITGGKYRGRTYIPGLATSANDPATGRVASVPAGNLALGAEAFRLACETDLVPLVVYSRVGTGLATPVDAVRVDTDWDVQRRRGD